MELNIKYLNLICTDLGGVGGHTLNVKAENEICTLLGGVGGHTLELKAINEIYSLVFGAGTFKTNLSALNAILAASGEQPEITEVRAWKKIQEGTQLNYTQKLINQFAGKIVALWPMQESEGTVIADVVNGRNGNYGGVSFSQGGIDSMSKSVELLNTTSYISLYSSALNTNFPKSEGTFMFAVKLPTGAWDQTGERIMAHIYLNDSNEIYLKKLSQANYFQMYVKFQGALKTYTYYYTHTNKFMFIAVKWSVSNNYFSGFWNGNKLFEINETIAPLLGTLSSTMVVLGAYSSASTYANLSSRYSHAILLNEAVSDAEIYKSVRASANIVFEGDSRSTIDHIYPSKAIDALIKNYAVTNMAVSGAIVEDLIARSSTVDALLKPSAKNILIVWIGVNNGALTAQQLFDKIKEYCVARKAAGWTIILCSEIDGKSAALITSGWPARYIALNVLIKADNSFYDYLADLGADARLQNANDTQYYLADKIHPNNAAGADVIAGIVSPIINQAS